ncbi:type II toxin-antitoxin system Phd/YefM family antitoxin [Streptomyces uncialis]|uniref:type II toxin-antitoxin system Phd/YefM family antitoxin n=1 Tax=Streptomyces uncialis TaxID=1048205 RepID=UPI002253648A|nr:type II toxin-antitoxin system prevent-host-death family antitoxin [Streptomyces uncialis]MCX4664886.1 type II toxin-antitoxin system prevent-host-death family antitoxin [Streptomyces uncialis]
MRYMEVTAREFSQQSSQILAAAARGETITVTKNGVAVARVVPVDDDIPPYPTDLMGEIDLPDLGLPDLTDDDIEETLQGDVRAERGDTMASAPVPVPVSRR